MQQVLGEKYTIELSTKLAFCYNKLVHALYHNLLLLGSVAAAYFWLSVPSLEKYSVQAFGITVLLYFLVKRFKRTSTKELVFLPGQRSEEMAFVTFAFLLIIGDTGNLSSFLFPITFVHLFFLAMTSETSTALTTTAAIMLFHFGLSRSLNLLEISNLISIAIVLVFYLFAKYQYRLAWQEKIIIDQEDAEIDSIQAENNLLRQKITALEAQK